MMKNMVVSSSFEHVDIVMYKVRSEENTRRELLQVQASSLLVSTVTCVTCFDPVLLSAYSNNVPNKTPSESCTTNYQQFNIWKVMSRI